MMILPPASWLTGLVAGAVLVVLTPGDLRGATSPQEDEWPTFRPGRWEFTRTLEMVGGPAKPTKLTRTACVDPTSEMKKQNEVLVKGGCRLKPVVRRGEAYTFSASCTVQGRPSTTTSVLTARGQDSYTVDVEARVGDQETRETLSARRLGDCEL